MSGSSHEPSEWSVVGSLAELPPGATAEAVAGDQIVALANVDGVVHAIDGMCAHQGGPLGKGALDGCTLTCPWHGWQYDVTDGRALLSERVRQRRYRVRIDGDTILVSLRG